MIHTHRYSSPCHSPESDSLVPRDRPRSFLSRLNVLRGFKKAKPSVSPPSSSGPSASGPAAAANAGAPARDHLVVNEDIEDAREAAEEASALLRAVLNLQVGAESAAGPDAPPGGGGKDCTPIASSAEDGERAHDNDSGGLSSVGQQGVCSGPLMGGVYVGLSLGQQQLLCLARMLLQRRSVVLLDECTASIDPVTSSVMRQVCGALNRRRSATLPASG